jgi:Mg2+ and Co2+ transporter CorA
MPAIEGQEPARPLEGVSAHLFDADGRDRAIAVDEIDPAAVCERCLLWVDIDLDAVESFEAIADRLALTPRDRARIETDSGRARVFHHTGRVHLTLEALEPEAGQEDESDLRLARREIDLLASLGVVVSVHHGPVEALERFAAGISGDSSLGALLAADLLSSLADEVVAGYLDVAERIERRIDRLDRVALDGRAGEGILRELASVRHQIGVVRRTLAPHRAALAALARPDMAEESGVGRPWPGLVERVEGAVASVESLREALLGTYDIYMGRAAQRANDVMKVLTLLSAVFLPAVVLAGVMGMNFELPFFDRPDNFFLVVAVMAVFAIALIVVARARHWF